MEGKYCSNWKYIKVYYHCKNIVLYILKEISVYMHLSWNAHLLIAIITECLHCKTVVLDGPTD